MIRVITSKDNGRIKFAASLKEKKYREMHKMFLAETKKTLEMALKKNLVSEVFTTEFLDIPEEIMQNIVPEDLIKKLSNNVNPDGVVFIAKMLEDEVNNPKKILYLDEINDPGNMGTLIRTALAFSYDLIVLSDNCVSIYNEKVVNSDIISCYLQLYHIESDELQSIKESFLRQESKFIDGWFLLFLSDNSTGDKKEKSCAGRL